jgi:hypothetical protein
MARPRREKVIVVPLKLWLIPGRDDDVIAFFNSIPAGQKARAVVRAMRSGLTRHAPEPNEKDECDAILDALGNAWE